MSETQNDDPSDAELAIRCQLGQRDAWDQLVRRWHPRLYTFVTGMLSDHGSVDDVVQTVWLKAVRSFARLKDPERTGAWLFRIARLTITDQLRRSYRQPPIADVVDIANENNVSEQFEVSEDVAMALGRLHPVDREVVLLHYFQHLAINEVASICDVPAGTVKSRLHRARGQLRSRLKTQELSDE